MPENKLMINKNIGLLLIFDKLDETADRNEKMPINFYYDISDQEQETIEKSYLYCFYFPDKSIITENGILVVDFLELIACKIEREYEITELEYNICKEIFKWEGLDYVNLKTKQVYT